MTIGPIAGPSGVPGVTVATVPAMGAAVDGSARLAALLPAITRMGTAIDAALVLVDAAQLETLLGLLGARGEVAAPAPTVLARFAAAPMPFAPVPLPAASTAPRPASVSGRGVVGGAVEPGSSLVPRIALEQDHGGRDVKAFAVAGPGHRFRIVLLGPDWSAGLPAGRRGATLVAAALHDALREAFRGEPPVRVDVEARASGLLEITWRGATGIRVAPVLDNVGFALLARPGGPTPEEVEAARGEATPEGRGHDAHELPDRTPAAGPPPSASPPPTSLPSVAAFASQAALASTRGRAAHGGGRLERLPTPALVAVVPVGLLVGLLALGGDGIGAGLLFVATALCGLVAVGLVVGAVARGRSEEGFERER